MMKINDEMTKYVILANKYDEEKISSKVDEFSENVFSKIKMIDERVLIFDMHNKMKTGELNYDWIKSQYNDYTGYEASCNEIRISDFINIESSEKIPFLFLVLENLKSKLKKKYPDFNFVLIGIINKNDIELRFHILRKNEMGWLKEDIDLYKEAIIVENV